MKFLAVAFLALLAVASAAGPWTNCGTSADHLTISSLTISPAELARGQPFTISFSGKLDEQITGGTASISVQFLGITVFSQNYDLCQLLSEGGSSCPVAAGPLSVSKTETFPGAAPKGSYTGKLVIKDQNGAEVTCLSFAMKVTAPALHEPVFDDMMIEHINRNQNGWTAKRNDRFEGMTVGDVKKMLRVRASNQISSIPRLVAGDAAVAALPNSFDSRTQWPGCVHAVRDQQQCGSCWAFSASEVLSDRFCIDSKGATQVILSPQWLVSCDTSSFGCDGGYLDTTWSYMQSNGLPTDTCVPYTSGGGDSGTCPTTCSDGSALTFYKATNLGSATDATSVATALVAGGPVQAAFSVYQDFMSYSTGVYKHTSGSLLGGHAVEIVGYGVDSTGTKYWNVKNSWNTSWGQQGYFWILRGTNECGIESQVFYGDAAV